MKLVFFTYIFFIISGLANAQMINFEELKQKPKGIAKDYYIYRLLKNNKLTKEQAKTLQDQVHKNNGVLKKKLDELLPVKQGEHDACYDKKLMDSNLTCQAKRTTLFAALKMDSKTRNELAKILNEKYPKKAKILNALNEQNPAIAIANLQDSANFLALLNASDKEKRDKLFEYEFDTDFIHSLVNQNGFRKTFIQLVLNLENDKFRRNFVKIPAQNLVDETAFWLGINAITLKKENEAIKFFEFAQMNFKDEFKKDNALFWLYLISKDQQYLQKLADSKNLNIYSLFAKEKLQKEPFVIIVPSPLKEKAPDNYNSKDPFQWQLLREKAKEIDKQSLTQLASQFYTKKTIGEYIYFMHVLNGWDRNYFAMPDSKELENISAEKKALIYAIARQESRFIPTSISTSYALGTMQFMPFLANNIAKDKKIENFDQDDMFDIDTAFKFANIHLDYLQKFLSNPLFVAYAYNGGIGFTRRMLAKGHLFKEGNFEPFLSMELIPYEESRNYGKKVLANFYVYSILNGSNIKISTLFENLIQP